MALTLEKLKEIGEFVEQDGGRNIDLAASSDINYDNITTEWFYALENATNSPTNHRYFVHTIYYPFTSLRAVQIAYGINISEVYYRRGNTTWQAWVKISP